MKIRIAKKKLKKIISEDYRIDKRRVKLRRTYFAFKSGYVVIVIATIVWVFTL